MHLRYNQSQIYRNIRRKEVAGYMQDSYVDNQTERYHAIDIIKVLGLLFVILYHSATYQYDWLEDGQALFYFRYYFRTILSTCVPLFFFANGYLLLNKQFDLRKHIVKSIKITVLTVIWGIIGLLVISQVKGSCFSFKEFVSNLWHWKPIGWIDHLWYMGALICIYAFFPMIKSVYDNQKKIFYFFTIAAAVFTFCNTLLAYGGSLFIDLFFNETIISRRNIFNMFNPFRGIYGYSFVYFCVGGIAREKENIIINAKHRIGISFSCIIVSCLLLFGLGVFFSNAKGKLWDVVWNGYDTIFTFINVICIYALCLGYNGKLPIIKIISCNTLGIYFIHNIIIRLTKEYVIQIPLVHTVVGNIAYACAVIILCLSITLIIKKIPVLKHLVKL